ncbi:MAG: Stk1 family PASTA domain-containing Ser/Thr kinase [Lachnospiraceae bacterium]|nr:Stk1 family PASTA domain-containing Ser/Thr kinase [Lachnospiraceae bacterium]
MIKIGMLIGDRYEILEKIGNGGMSDVYKAKCHKLNRFVAVKVLKQEFGENENFVSKFKVEAQAAAGLMHPNIVNVYDVGNENGINYIVMELVEGITLKKYIEKKARLSVKEAISIAIQVSMGIEAAHNNRIIHRDIKPQNIIISKDGKVKVTDFGIAKAATSNTITSNVMGSVHYTSPEQARGGFSDEKSDIYSLGITLFEMLTGRVPFNGDTTVAIAIKHIQEPMPSPRDYVAEIPVSVEQIVYKCTQKSPDRRYQSMPEVVEDLKRSLMTPDEDFVKIVDPDETASTRVITEQEVKEIKQQVQKKSSVTGDSIRLRKELEEERTKKKKAVEVKEKEKEEYDPRMEKITTILAIIAAVVIGVIAIYLVGKVAGVFPTGDRGNQIGVEQSMENPAENSGQDSGNGTSEQSGFLSGGNVVGVPQVLGWSYAEASATLKDNGYEVAKEESFSTDVTAGNVISQSPEAGTDLAKGNVVTLRVSLGAEITKVRVPNVVGKDQATAIEELMAAGLQPGKVDETTNEDSSLAGKVCYQSYSVGSYVDSGTVIDMKISTGVGTSTYNFIGNIAGPGEEDGDYAAGTEVTVVLATADGQEIYRTTTSTFPLPMNVAGITGAESGLVTFFYYVDLPATTTTDENGNVVTVPGGREERNLSRSVKFAKE